MGSVCSFCGNKSSVQKKVQYIYRHDDKFLAVNNVPCEECTYCGERYYLAPVIKRIEREFAAIHHGGKKPEAEVTMPMEEFAAIAE